MTDSIAIQIHVRIHPRGWRSLAEGGEGKAALAEYVVPFAEPLGQPGTNGKVMALILATVDLARQEGMDPEQVYAVLKYQRGEVTGYRTILRRTLIEQLPRRR